MISTCIVTHVGNYAPVTDIVNTGIGLSSNMDGYYEFDESGQGKQVQNITITITISPFHQVVVGVCAMEKKTLSKPMKEILTRLEEFEYIKTYIFSEKVILEEPVERWPVVDCLISFHSKVVSSAS